MPDECPNAAQVYRALAAPVLGYLRAQRVPEPEDVLGEVFLQVARDMGRFRGDEAALRRWVFSIAHNRAVDAHRRRVRHRVSAENGYVGAGGPRAVQVADPPPGPIDPGLVEALAALSPDQREVVVLRFVADLPLEAVARITRRTVGAVKALQHRALDNLRKIVPPA